MPERLQGIHALLVEDNPGDARLLRELLAEVPAARLLLTHVERLADVLERLRTDTFDVVLLDLTLPDSDGLPTFERVRAAAPRQPIILLTGLDDDEVALKCMQMGAQDYLVKGQVTGQLLVKAVRHAIERKRAEEELRQRDALIADEIKMAQELQKLLLPQRKPVFPTGVAPEQSALRFTNKYLPTTALGGDFFDYLTLAETKAGVFICDVMGHGVHAALVTAMIRTLVEEQSTSQLDPGRFLMELNGRLGVLREPRKPLFVTAFYAVVDAMTGQMGFATAGHPSPLLIRAQTRTAARLRPTAGSTGPALGLFESSHYTTQDDVLEIGDRVVLFTDGLCEITDAQDTLYGEERLLVSAQQRVHEPSPALLEGLIADARRFSGKHDFDDDVCLVCVERAAAVTQTG